MVENQRFIGEQRTADDKALWQEQLQGAVGADGFDFDAMGSMGPDLLVKNLGCGCGPIQSAAVAAIAALLAPGGGAIADELGTADAIVRSGGIHRLVSLLGGKGREVQDAAAEALGLLVSAHEENLEMVTELGGVSAVEMVSNGRHHEASAASARQGRFEAVFGEEGADSLWGLQLAPTVAQGGGAAGGRAVISGVAAGSVAAEGGWGLRTGLVLVGISFGSEAEGLQWSAALCRAGTFEESAGVVERAASAVSAGADRWGGCDTVCAWCFHCLRAG